MDCLPRYARNELELMPGYLNDLGEFRPEAEKELENRCAYEGAVYEEGSQWESTHKRCQMCSCHRGKVTCSDMVCPKANCSRPIIVEGECCASCQDDSSYGSSARGCHFAEKFYLAGSRWHPYIPPFGFTRCATCTCNVRHLKSDFSNIFKLIDLILERQPSSAVHKEAVSSVGLSPGAERDSGPAELLPDLSGDDSRRKGRNRKESRSSRHSQ